MSAKKQKIDAVEFSRNISAYFRPLPDSNLLVYDRVLAEEPAENFSLYSDVSGYDTVIVKVGTNIVTHKSQKRDAYNMKCIAEELTKIRKTGRNVMLVSSGAIGLGRKERLRKGEIIPSNEKSLPHQKSIDAWEGQYLLYTLWLHHFCLQPTEVSLITHADIKDERKKDKLFRNYKNCLNGGIIPVINEDDKRSIEEIDIQMNGERVFRDNDGLAGLIASQLSNDGYKTLLIILSSTDGIYTAESCRKGQFTPIRIVKDPAGLEQHDMLTTSTRGRGGMRSKIESARDAALNGVYVVIANGQYCNHDAGFQKGRPGFERRYDVLEAILQNKVVGTRFLPKGYAR